MSSLKAEGCRGIPDILWEIVKIQRKIETGREEVNRSTQDQVGKNMQAGLLSKPFLVLECGVGLG